MLMKWMGLSRRGTRVYSICERAKDILQLWISVLVHYTLNICNSSVLWLCWQLVGQGHMKVFRSVESQRFSEVYSPLLPILQQLGSEAEICRINIEIESSNVTDKLCCRLLQIVIESGSSAVQYASFFVHSRKPINGSIVFDLPHEHLYLATLTKVCIIELL